MERKRKQLHYISTLYEYYKSWSLSACSLGFALFTLSLHYIYIYTLEAQCSFARVCSIHNLSPSSLDLNETALASLSLSPLHSWLRSRSDPVRPGMGGGAAFSLSPSAREGIHCPLHCSLSPSACARGPLTPSSMLPYVVWADPTSRHTPSHIPTTLRYNFL
jgi:hypothetical protein